VLAMESGISISEDPNIRFSYLPNGATTFGSRPSTPAAASSRANGRPRRRCVIVRNSAPRPPPGRDAVRRPRPSRIRSSGTGAEGALHLRHAEHRLRRNIALIRAGSTRSRRSSTEHRSNACRVSPCGLHTPEHVVGAHRGRIIVEVVGPYRRRRAGGSTSTRRGLRICDARVMPDKDLTLAGPR